MPPRLSKKADTVVLQIKVTKSHKRKISTLAQQGDFEGNVSRLVRSLIDAAWSSYEGRRLERKQSKTEPR